MSIAEVIPVPAEVQQRTWEAAYVLITDYADRLNQTQRQQAAWVAARKPERLGWDDARLIFNLHSGLVERRI